MKLVLKWIPLEAAGPEPTPDLPASELEVGLVALTFELEEGKGDDARMVTVDENEFHGPDALR
jgi:hypothetical protein